MIGRLDEQAGASRQRRRAFGGNDARARWTDASAHGLELAHNQELEHGQELAPPRRFLKRCDAEPVRGRSCAHRLGLEAGSTHSCPTAMLVRARASRTRESNQPPVGSGACCVFYVFTRERLPREVRAVGCGEHVTREPRLDHAGITRSSKLVRRTGNTVLSISI